MEVGIMKSSEDYLKKTSQQVEEASDYSVHNTSDCVEVTGEVKEDFNESPLLDRQINIESTKNVMQEMPMQMRDHLSISSDSKSSMKQNHEGHPEDYLKYQQSPLPQIENFVEGEVHENITRTVEQMKCVIESFVLWIQCMIPLTTYHSSLKH